MRICSLALEFFELGLTYLLTLELNAQYQQSSLRQRLDERGLLPTISTPLGRVLMRSENA